MRLIAFLAAIAVLFCLTETSSAQAVYTGMVTTASLPGAETPSAKAAGLRMLTWPGKVQEAPRRQANAAHYRIWNPETGQALAAPPAAVPAPRQPAALPSSIYDPAPPAARAAPQPLPPPAPIRQAQAQGQPTSASDGDYQPAHFYSLYREYGQNPDPIPPSQYDPKAAPVPLNAQFFASSSTDLAQPPPPVPHTVTTTGGRVMEAVPPSPDDSPG